MPTTATFDRLGAVYRPLEYVAFGRMLERARMILLPKLSSCRNVLLLGDGDGRCLEALVGLAPEARATSIDASAAMIARATRRVRARGAESRVTFARVDARQWRCPPAHFDAVVTMFFLDCFTHTDVDAIVAAVAPGLQRGGLWLFVDFAMPQRGFARLHARLWVSALYAFFRSQTGIAARVLPPSEAILEQHGFRRIEIREFRAGLVRSVLFERV